MSSVLASVLPTTMTDALKTLEDFLVDPPVKVTDLQAYFDAVLHADSINDRYLVLEKLLVLMARLDEENVPATKAVSQKIQEFVIDLLYKDLPHPPSSFLAEVNLADALTTTTPGPNLKYAARSADGSHYTSFAPRMGQAGTPYARSVPALSTLPRSSLPDPELVFDMLLKRDKYKEHPGGISSLFFAVANLIIHSLFSTNPRDWTINDVSSYLDLSVLYGSSQNVVDGLRRHDGSGRLHEDVFGDPRLLLMPPATCAMLVLLCRNHNFIAERILRINENGSYKDIEKFTAQASGPHDEKTAEAKKLEEAQKAQDKEIFDRARLVNCGYFMHIILGDYVGAILGLVRDGHNWRLDPLMEIRRSDHTFSPRGEGNVVSIEFNLLYRWHATLSKADTEWTNNEFKALLGDVKPSQVTPTDFHKAIRGAIAPPPDYRKWTFGGLKRGDNGRFDDGDLATILQDATKNRAAAFGARGVPEVLRVIEIMGIEQERSWGTCSLNEFRKFIGLQPYKSFAEWNPDKDIQAAAASLYQDIDNLELHVGMQAEESKTPGPGAGLCPGYTISRAILADAVCLTRGDPYLTVDMTPFNFTTWGYNDVQYDKNDGSYGGLLTKLLFRTLPNHYTPRSAYAHFPFLDPEYMKTDTKIPLDKYDFNPPSKSYKRLVVVGTYDGVKQVATSSDFAAPYDMNLRAIIPDIGSHIPNTAAVQKLLTQDKARWAVYFRNTTRDLITKASIPRPGVQVRHLDIVRDVINVLPIKWICQELAGLTISDSIDGHSYTASQYYDMFAEVCQYIYVNTERENDWHLREGSAKTFEHFRDVVKGHVDAFSSWLSVDGNPLSYNDHSKEFLRSLNKMVGSEGKTAAIVALFSEVVPTAVQFSQILSSVVDYHLQSGTPLTSNFDALVADALTEDPIVSGFYRTPLRPATVPDNVRVNPGDRVWASVVEAHRDGNRASTSPMDIYFGVERKGLLAPALFNEIVPGILQEFLSLPGLQKTGNFNRFYEYRNGTKVQMFVNLKGNVIPFPDSLNVQYTHK
ncbi:heme peroxidase [Mucidula mucida]|nr:heme peroxidase [Mucidula mucida]